MIELRTPTEIEQMRPAGEFVAGVLARLREQTTVGTNLLEIDDEVRRMIVERGATSCYVDYAPSFGNGPFGHYICTSVNDAVLHGLPHDYALQDGDLVSLDLAVNVDGWVADSAVSFVVGEARPEDLALIRTTEAALEAGIDAARAGARLGDVSAAIGRVCRADGHRVNVQFGGHGVGREMHGEPHLPNDGKAGRGMRLEPGLVVAVEPWLMLGTDKLAMDPDGWTLRSANGRRTAHSEHTIAITGGDPVVLTRRPGDASA